MYDTAAKSGGLGETASPSLRTVVLGHRSHTRVPPGPLAGTRRLPDPVHEPPEAQLSKRNIPAPQLSQWEDGCVRMATVSKETWRGIQQGRTDMQAGEDQEQETHLFRSVLHI